MECPEWLSGCVAAQFCGCLQDGFCQIGLCFISIESLYFESVRNGDVLLSGYGSKEGEEGRAEKGYSSVRRTGAVYPAKVGSSKFNMMDCNMFYLCMLLDMCLLVKYEHAMLF